MKRLLLFLLLILIPTPLFATTTVTGTIQNLGTGVLGSGTFVRFWLRGCGGNQPRVNSTALIAPSQGGVFYFDMVADANGKISGTLYSTRDSTGNNGGDIECGGSTTAVWYGMQAFVNGKGGPEVPIHAKSGVTLDITSVTPISTNPVVVAPTGDTTYLRLDGGNSPLTGAVTFNNLLNGNDGGTLNGNYTFGNANTHNGTETFTNGLIANALTDNTLTVGNCVQVTTGGLFTTSSGPCGTSSGTITATGSPVSGNLSCFSGATSITNCDLSGDGTTSGTAVLTIHKVDGVVYPSGPSTSTVPVVTATNSVTYVNVPNCADSSGQHLNYNSSTFAFSCGTTSSASVNFGRNGTVCSTALGSYSVCNTTVNLNFTEPDTNFSASCTGVGPSGHPHVEGITKGTSYVTVTISNGASNGAVASTYSELDCVVTGT